MNDRNKVILLIVVIISSLSGIYLHQGYNHYTSLIDQVVQGTEEEFNSAIDSVQACSFPPYSRRIDDFIKNTPDVVAAFADRDREALYQKTLPGYQALVAENKFFQVMHFHLPDGTTFLRMHNPSFLGDDLTDIRPIVTTVHQEKKSIAGYEMGRHGPFYRVVRPVFFGGDYVGALEFGIQVHELVDVLEKKIEAPVTVYFRGDLLEKATHFSLKSSYIQFGDICLLTHDRKIYNALQEDLILKKEDQQIVVGDQTFVVHSHSLFKNYRNKAVGGIAVLQDITPFLVQKRQFLIQSVVLILSLAVVAIIVLIKR